jgi:proteasome lid subunit RPN8/RPN11
MPQALYDDMIEHARQEAPNECVGLLATRESEVVKLYRATNAAASPLRFEIDPREQLSYHNEIEAQGLDLGAIYHSHTRTDPRPSQTDINFARGWPGVLWVIVGLHDGESDVRTWRIDDGRVEEAELLVQ